MLILPYQTRFAARSLPWVTLALIAVNVFVHLFLQGADPAREERALAYYAGSALPSIELPRYREWLVRQNDARAGRRLQALAQLDAAPPAVRAQRAVMLMQSDAGFVRLLAAGQVVRSDELVFQQWSEERRRFNALLGEVFTERYKLAPDGGTPWQLLTYQFLHGGMDHLFANMVILLLAGAFAEAALGRGRFLLTYLASGAVAGAAHLLVSDVGLIGASGAVAGTVAMVAVLYGTRRVPVFYWLFVYFDTARMPAIFVLPIWVAKELAMWALSGGESPVAYWAHLAGLATGAPLAWLLRPRDPTRVDRIVEAEFADEKAEAQRSSLLRQAQEAAARLDTRRAARLYRELVELHPGRLDYLVAYFNVALIGHDTDLLADAALRLLWLRTKGVPDELRKAFLTMSQPQVLQVLPVDEQLRLARRLVRSREDAAALRVLDGILEDMNLRSLYARQTADCLLGLFTTYTRYGLKGPADQVRSRLARYFPTPSEIGGLPPSTVAPATIRGSTTRGRSSLRGPDTQIIDLSR